MASIDSLQFHSLFNLQSSIGKAKLQIPSNLVVFRQRPENLKWVYVETNRRFVCKAIGGDSSTPDEEIQNTQNDADVVATTQNNISSDSEISISRFRSMITTLSPVVFVRAGNNSIWIGICIATTVLVAAIRAYVVRKSRDNQRTGSVADLVRRG